MADYHPLIARAVAGLDKNTGENRRALYERARTALVAQLRGVVPALEESEITRERLALEEAIRKVEAESARHAREAARPTFIKRAEAPRREEPPRPEQPARPAVGPARPGATQSTVRRSGGPAEPPRQQPAPQPTYQPAPEPPPSRPEPPPAPRPAQPPPAPAARRSQTLQDEAARAFRDVTNDPQAAAEARNAAARYDYERPIPDRGLPPAPALPPLPPPERHPLEEYGSLEPQVQPENLWALPLDTRQPPPPADYDGGQTPQPRYDTPYEEAAPPRRMREPRSYGKYIRLGLIAVLVLGAVTMLYWQRSNIAGIAGGVASLFRSAPPVPREAQTPSRPKISDRLGQPTQPQPGVAVAQRVVLYEEDPADPQGKRFIGTAVWRTETKPATAGRPPELAVRADIEIPDRKMSVTWSLRRNTDQSLPASHTIEIVFNANDAASGGVQNVPGVLMKQAEQTRGVPLAGLAVKVTPGFFLIGLSALEADTQRNIQLLKERSWFDIPIIYNNNRRAILAMEKGTPGEKAFNEAFASWRQ
ncbi:MAG TPA: hypothetical protein VIU42_15985 [Xanthobacteraceae bacterium]